jgi:hypothetical protein
MAPMSDADGRVRDRYLAGAMAILLSAQVLHLIGNSIRLPLVLESRAGDIYRIVSWLDLISNLPFLAAASFGVVAFLAGGGERSWWLRHALLFAAFGFALTFVSSVVELASLEGSQPEGMKLALLSACLETFALTAGFIVAASAFAGEGDPEMLTRNGKLKRAGLIFGTALLLAAVSAWAYDLAFSTYAHHDDRFGLGLIIEGFGAMAVALSLFYGATAFGAADSSVEDSIQRRERRLFIAVIALAASYSVVALGEAVHAAGITALGYPESSAIAGWIFASFRLGVVAAFLCAARGFKAFSDP